MISMRVYSDSGKADKGKQIMIVDDDAHIC